MLYSMTGFGRSFFEDERWTQIWEIRSVNGRHLDIRWRLPHEARTLEAVLEKRVRQVASRGRLEISLTLQKHKMSAQPVVFNEAQAEVALEVLSDFATMQGHSFEPDYNRFLSLSSYWEEANPELNDELGSSLEEGLDVALEDWNESRKIEGKALETDILTRITQMEEWGLLIFERAPSIKEERFEQVRERVREVLESVGQELDEGRFLQEIVFLADKMDVSEELTRLNAHFSRLRELLKNTADAGRKLDFTLQECFREIATCGNKIQDIQVSRTVVDVKNELEKCREQVQNVE